MSPDNDIRVPQARNDKESELELDGGKYPKPIPICACSILYCMPTFINSGIPNPAERLTSPCPKVCSPDLNKKVIISRKQDNGFNMLLMLMLF
jgi:hypothetical protein